MSWDWLDVTKTSTAAFFGALSGGGLVSVLVQVLVPAYRDWRDRRRRAAPLAMRLADMLEAYASACWSFIQSNDEVADARADGMKPGPRYQRSLPKLPTYPDDTDGWRAMKRALAGMALHFHNRIQESRDIIADVLEFTDDEDRIGVEVERQVVRLYSEAVDITVALRREYLGRRGRRRLTSNLTSQRLHALRRRKTMTERKG